MNAFQTLFHNFPQLQTFYFILSSSRSFSLVLMITSVALRKSIFNQTRDPQNMSTLY